MNVAPDRYTYFRVEAHELAGQLGKGVLDLEKGGSPEIVARLLRLAHTLKGAARVVKQREIADHAHAVEEILAPFRDSPSSVPRDRIDALLTLLDDVGSRVGSLGPSPDRDSPSPHRQPVEESFRTVRADLAEMDALLNGLAEAHALLGPLRNSLGTVERVRQLGELLADEVEAARARETPRSNNRVSSQKAGSVAEELRALSRGLERGLTSGVDQIDRELRQVRATAEQLRLAPASTMFTSLERTARDTAQALGRKVVFEGRGGDVRLDAHLIAVVQGALLQVVRNAVAHGIEPGEGREAAGKPPEGRVTLEVLRRGRQVVFTSTDDGRGVDLDAVRQAMQQKGLLTPEAQRLGPEDLLRLLFKGGLSTSGAVTEVSGRGIGLDIVREVAARLGGEVSVKTKSGQGTSVELIVPLSLASVETLVVEADGTTVTIPTDAVRQTLRIAADGIARTSDGESIIHEGKVIPFVPLSRVLSGERAPTHRSRPWSVVIVQGGAGAAAIAVDRLLGTASVVLRPLPELAPAAAIVAGASLDADGNPQLVLDPDALVDQAGRSVLPLAEPDAPQAPVLIVDDSLTTRMLEQSILESAGYEVDLATSGEEALEKARRRRYALFLVDVEMPGMDGFTLIERIRSDPTLRDTPSILVTSRASAEDRRRGEEAGALAYIVKSEFDQGDLLKRIRTLVR